MINFQRTSLLFFLCFSWLLYAQPSSTLASNSEIKAKKIPKAPLSKRIVIYTDEKKDKKEKDESANDANSKETKDNKTAFEKMIELQLQQDKNIPPMQKGVLFVPYLVDAQREPSYLIYNEKGQYIKDGKPGHRVFLRPGKYRLLIGSGPKHLRFTKEVDIELEQLTIVKPDWSALIVDTVDEFGNRKRKGYLVYEEESKFLILTGFGADASKGERTSVWIVPPDLYRITKRGENADSLKNYITVRTVKGKASYAKMIFDEETNRVIGGGETTDFFFLSSGSGWTFNNLISAVFSFTNSENVQGKQNTETYSFGAEIKSNINFDKQKYYLVNRLEIFEHFQSTITDTDEKGHLINTKDSLKNSLVGIYRINNYIGPYTSFSFKTNLFRHYAYDLVNVRVVETDGSSRILEEAGSFLLSDFFGSTSIQEGVGLNLEYKYTTILSFFLRLGYGFKQDISRNVYLFNETATELTRVNTYEYAQGPEISFYLTSSPFAFLDITIDMLSLFPDLSMEKSYFTFQSTVMLKLSSFVSLNYNLWIERNGIIDDLFQKTHALTIQVYYRFY